MPGKRDDTIADDRKLILLASQAQSWQSRRPIIHKLYQIIHHPPTNFRLEAIISHQTAKLNASNLSNTHLSNTLGRRHDQRAVFTTRRSRRILLDDTSLHNPPYNKAPAFPESALVYQSEWNNYLSSRTELGRCVCHLRSNLNVVPDIDHGHDTELNYKTADPPTPC